jgi:hypothetical protein
MSITANVTGGKLIAVNCSRYEMSTCKIIIIYLSQQAVHEPLTLNYELHTYHSRFIPEGVAEVSQIFLLKRPRFTKIS